MVKTRFTFAGCLVLCFAQSMAVNAQFKEVGPAPVSATVARQQVRTLIEKVEFGNTPQTAGRISSLLAWYRDLIDEELLAAWQKDGRANLTSLIESLADSHLAAGIVEYSWRRQREATFIPAYAPMLAHLMLRYPDSAKPFRDDLLAAASNGQQAPDLSPAEAETVCRILLDMPDTGTWRKDALQILPHYRRAAESLLLRDLHGDDQEKSYQAQIWLADLKMNVPIATSERQSPPPRPRPSPPPVEAPSAPSVPRAAIPEPILKPAPAPPAPPQARPSVEARSGTLECRPGVVPQNAEYVFLQLPLGKLQLDYDKKVWDARLVPGEGQTQRLILINKSRGPQKHCVVHWSTAE